TLSWSTVNDPAGPIIGYDWQVSTSSSFSSAIAWGTTWYPAQGTPPPNQDSLGGQPNGSYFWRVRTVRQGQFTGPPVHGNYTAPRGFTITGSVAGTPAAPTVTGPANGAKFHPSESFDVTWS